MDMEKLRKHGIDKIAFLLLLALGLVCAKFIISFKRQFKLSAPITVQATGVSVSIPAGGGFMPVGDGFKFDKDEFRLSSIMQSGSTAISVNWRYFIIPNETLGSEKFTAEAKAVNGKLAKTEAVHIETLGLTFDTAKITDAMQKGQIFFIASAIMPDGRTLKLEVASNAAGEIVAEEIFGLVLKSVKFKPENALSNGIRFLNGCKQQQLADEIAQNTEQNFYYIRNFTGKNLGFVTDGVVLKNDKINSAGMYFIASGRNAYVQREFLVASKALETFQLADIESNLIFNRETKSSVVLKDGVLIIENSGRVKQILFSSSMVPENLFDTVLEIFLKSELNEIMFDMILSDGDIKPAYIVKLEENKFKDSDAAAAVKITYFETNQAEQTIYFDTDGKIKASEMHGDASYRLFRASQQQILKDFPQWQSQIEQIGEIFKQGT